MNEAKKLTTEELTMLVELLKKIEPGFLPLNLFLQVARLTVLSIIELVPMRFDDNQLQVLLIPRESSDDIWPGMLHTPGTVLRPTDVNLGAQGAFDRIVEEELMGTKVSTPVFVRSLLHKSRRGVEQSQIFLTEVKSKPIVGKFYNVDELPANLVNSQREFIQAVANYYKENML
jgi:hypothetical protein